jgi:meiotic recombination protein REC8, fungi type
MPDPEDLLEPPSGVTEPHAPAEDPATQTAARSRPLRATLDTEVENFLEFVRARVGERDAGGVVEFETLLPPALHTRPVAAQAFLHVLTLASKGLLIVKQEIGYGPIVMGAAG